MKTGHDWDSFWCPISPWPYTPIVFHTVDVPAMMYDKNNNMIYCHPSIKAEMDMTMSSEGCNV